MSNANRTKIMEFYESCVADGLTPIRILRLLQMMRRIGVELQKPFVSVTRNDVQKLLVQIEKRDYSDWTKHDYRVALKKFYKWLRGTETYPPEVSWITTTVKNNHHLLPEQLLTEDDVKNLALSTDNTRDRALIMLLYEGGLRVGELLSLRIKHVTFDDYGAQITVTGKTGMRRVRIVASSPLLRQWIEEFHPQRENPDAPLWVGIGNVGKGEPIDYESTRMAIIRAAKRAGLKKAVNPHIFRHSRASDLANKLTEAQLKEMFGWTQGSDMAATYVHLSGRDVDKALLKIHGLVGEDEKKEEEKFKVIRCPRCGEKNSPIAKFCHKCRMVLSYDAYKEAAALAESDKSALETQVEAMVKKQVADALAALKPKIVKQGLS